jgi:ferredoxin
MGTSSEWIEEAIKSFARSPDNSLYMESGEPAWGEPLVGFSRGSDPLYAELKTMIGSFYWEPAEIFRATFPDVTVEAGDLSVIAWVFRLPPTERPYSGHDDYCPFRARGTCGRCVERCPADAITKQGHDKERCRRYILEVTARHIEQRYGLPETYGCGFCQTGVPCESRISAPGN